jgi:hypothetical protein
MTTLTLPLTVALANGVEIIDTRSLDGIFAVRAIVSPCAYVTLTHAADGTITIERSAAARPLIRGRLDCTYPAARAAWTGRLAAERVAISDDRWPDMEPVAAVALRAVAVEGRVPTGVDSAAVIAGGAARWRAMWNALTPALDECAAALVAQYRLGASHYQALVSRPALAQRAAMVPGLIACLDAAALRALPVEQASLAAVLSTAFGVPEANVLTPGRSAWFRRAPWADADAWPLASRATASTRVTMLRRVIAAVVTSGVTLDPTKLAAVPSSAAWCVLHTAMLNPRVVPLFPLIQKDLAAAVRVIERWNHVPAEAVSSFAGRASYVLDQLGLWGAEHPVERDRAQGLGRLSESTQGWLRTCAAADREEAESIAERERERARTEAEAAALALAEANEREAAAALAQRDYNRTHDRESKVLYPFPPPFVEVADAKYTMRFLPHNAALVAEGAEADHCVGKGGYFGGCWSGSQWIFTLRTTGTNAFQATVTVASESGDVSICLGQKDAKQSEAVWAWVRKAARIAHGGAVLPKGFAVKAATFILAAPKSETPAVAA